MIILLKEAKGRQVDYFIEGSIRKTSGLLFRRKQKEDNILKEAKGRIISKEAKGRQSELLFLKEDKLIIILKEYKLTIYFEGNKRKDKLIIILRQVAKINKQLYCVSYALIY